MNVIESLSTNKLLILATFLGATIASGWPLVHHFITGEYNENVVLDVEYENLTVDDGRHMLVLHVKPINKGSVPIQITGDKKHGAFEVELRKVVLAPDGMWLEPEKFDSVAKADILRHHPSGYSIEPSAAYDEVEVLTLPIGLYWVSAKMTFDDGDYVDQSGIIQLTDAAAKQRP